MLPAVTAAGTGDRLLLKLKLFLVRLHLMESRHSLILAPSESPGHRELRSRGGEGSGALLPARGSRLVLRSGIARAGTSHNLRQALARRLRAEQPPAFHFESLEDIIGRRPMRASRARRLPSSRYPKVIL